MIIIAMTGGIFVTDKYIIPIRNSLSNLISSGEVGLDHLFDVRMLIEPHMAFEAAHHATKEDIEEMRALFADSEANTGDANRHI